MSKKYGVSDNQRTRHSTFLDYNKDGFLDLFLLTQPPNPGSYSELSGSELLIPEYSLKLLKNTGQESFIDVSSEAGINLTGFPNAVSASDLNNDGWTDLYVANDFHAPDFMFINNQDGTFTNIADQALHHTSYYSMGVDVADINDDSFLDIFVLDMVAEDNFRLKSNMSGMDRSAFWKVVDNGGGYQYMYNTLQLNRGSLNFSDVAQITETAATDWSWANLIADFDNDGLKDIYVTNGLLYDIRNTDADKAVAKLVNDTSYKFLQENPDGGDLKSIWEILDIEKVIELLPSQPLQNYAFKNKGDLNFEKVMDDWGLNQKSFSNGAAYADFDNDGDLDLVVNNINEKAFIYKNNAQESNPKAGFLRVQLVDTQNKPVFGTRAELYINGKKQIQELTNVKGIYSSSEPYLHFGIGAENKLDSLIVYWPNGKRTKDRNLTRNSIVQFDMSKEIDYGTYFNNVVESQYFKRNTDFNKLKIAHSENDFDDFDIQVLLPHQLSQFGPALASGDVNNDGLDDFYFGGASGKAPTLFLQTQNGQFIKSSERFWKKESAYEDVDALFVDINNDGFKDLYVVSGGNEYPKNNVRYTDRLYLNNNGIFTKGAILNIERISGSVVKASDFDQDGDMDLFVGGRHQPHDYPIPANSMILRNENGQLVNLTKEIAPELLDLGMVTDAIWSDYDSDGDDDLMVVGEWMPIKIFTNKNGTLGQSKVSGIDNSSAGGLVLYLGILTMTVMKIIY